MFSLKVTKYLPLLLTVLSKMILNGCMVVRLTDIPTILLQLFYSLNLFLLFLLSPSHSFISFTNR